jgi:polar amino acid transport system substrate-binding protein
MGVDGVRRQCVAGGLAWLARPLAAHAQAGQAPRATLRFAVGETWAPPYIELREGHPVGGLMFELMEAIARAAGARAEYRLLPAQRVEAAIEAGEVDLHCLISPKWYDQPQPAERMGPPMVVLEDVLAAPAGTPPLELTEQHGLRVGTVLGYRYAELEPLFLDGRLLREEALNQQLLLEKLARGRSPVAVVDRLVLAAFNRAQPPGKQLVVLQALGQTITHCLISPHASLPVQTLRAALKATVDRGELLRLMARYR